MRVAALADVHGNAPALAAVLEEVEREAPDLVVFCGDLTWGSLPQETLALVRGTRDPGAVRARQRRPRWSERRIESVRATVDDLAARIPRILAFLGQLRADRLGRDRRARRDLLLPRLAALRRGVRHRARLRPSACVSSWSESRRAGRRHRPRPRAVRPEGRRHSLRRTRERRASERRRAVTRTGRCSARTSSFAARSTTSKRRWRSCARRTIHAWRRSLS